MNETKHKILIISNDKELKKGFLENLGNQEYQVISSLTAKEGLDQAEKILPDVIFLDLILPDPDISGIEVLKKIKKIDSNTIVFTMVSPEETIQTTIEIMKLDAYDYILKPLPWHRLKIIVEKAIQTHQLTTKLNILEKGGVLPEKIVGHSLKIQKVFKLIETASRFDIGVIVKGETGTGKELVARAIHGLSKRKNKPFIPVDCASLPETLIESELFGHEKGAYTGAGEQTKGRFELANQGTLFLDEIGNLTHQIQAKLLRAIQERKFMRVGGQKFFKFDARIISATNVDLREAIKNNRFRNDLFHRINVFEINLPPLRERNDDVIVLSHYFLKKLNHDLNLHIKRLSKEVENIFRNYHWPGNIRELENVMQSAMILAKRDTVLPEALPSSVRHAGGKTYLFDHFDPEELLGININSRLDSLSLKEFKKNVYEKIEKVIIKKCLFKTNGNKKRAADLLDIDYKSLFNKMKKYSLNKISKNR